ncbi:hypothetical protein [Enterobacter sp. CPE_E1214]|uniref:hypothetical protein n=1 Tax=unclassified Enterobacter TaxID=2608935 RepID=UPI00388F5113
MSSGLAWFKETSLETGQWIWGTLQGSFNEKQSISQILVDAVIGMIPLVGDVTAVRDLIAVSIGLAKDSRKRESTMEWVFLVILIFALIPVIGGVIKGVGRLVLMVGKDVAKNREILEQIIKFLNRVGEGDAVKWLAKLNVLKYQPELIEKMTGFCQTVITAINQILEARVGRLLPDRWKKDLVAVRDGFVVLKSLAAKMIPGALRELDAKLRVVQGMVYKGQIHTVASASGRATVAREAEAYLLEREVYRAAKPGSLYPSNSAEVVQADKLRAKYSKPGYPDLFATEVESAVFGGKMAYANIASFSGKITPMNAEELAGKTLYRVFGKAKGVAGETSSGGRVPGFWGYGNIPESAEDWRKKAAVLDEWNANGFIVIAHLPQDLTSKMPDVKAWHGTIAEQFGVKLANQYLEGGGEQLIVNLGDLAAQIHIIGEEVKASGQAVTREINGVKLDFHPTGWKDVNGKYGFGDPEKFTPPLVETRQLSDSELQSKTGRRALTGAARIEHQTSQNEQD